MRVTFRFMVVLGALAVLPGCSSSPLGNQQPGAAGAANDGGGAQNSPDMPGACSSALRQSLSLVDEVSTAKVVTLSQDGDERVLYIDASVGGESGADTHPWVYVALADGSQVGITDIDALTSKNWDLAFKRFVIRTNDGDSGPGKGAAVRVMLPWDQVTSATLGAVVLPTERWFDADCTLARDSTGQVITTYSGWLEYDQTNHVLNAADVVYVTAGADGSLYKVAILDYYSKPDGSHGAETGPLALSGHYKVRIAPLP